MTDRETDRKTDREMPCEDERQKATKRITYTFKIFTVGLLLVWYFNITLNYNITLNFQVANRKQVPVLIYLPLPYRLEADLPRHFKTDRQITCEDKRQKAKKESLTTLKYLHSMSIFWFGTSTQIDY